MNVIGVPVAILFLAFVCLMTFWLVYPYKTLEIKRAEVITPIVAQNDHVHYKLDYCKYNSKPATVHKSFVDGIVYRLPAKVSNVPEGCREGATVAVEIPHSLPPGQYKIQSITTYQVNPIRRIDVFYETDTFHVVNHKIFN